MGTPYIAMYPSDYLADTAHLGLTEHGVYWRMLLHYYQHGNPFPNDLEKINRVILASTPEEKRVTEYILGEFFTLQRHDDGAMYWHHARADREIANAEERVLASGIQKDYGRLGGLRSAETRRAKYGTAQPKKPEPPFEPPFEVPSEAKIEGFPKQPEPEPEKKKTHTHTRFAAREYMSARGLSDQTITDYLAIRKDKKLTPTLKAMEAIEEEATKAGITFSKAIETCCAQSWAGFKAAWLKDAAKPAVQKDWI